MVRFLRRKAHPLVTQYLDQFKQSTCSAWGWKHSLSTLTLKASHDRASSGLFEQATLLAVASSSQPRSSLHALLLGLALPFLPLPSSSDHLLPLEIKNSEQLLLEPVGEGQGEETFLPKTFVYQFFLCVLLFLVEENKTIKVSYLFFRVISVVTFLLEPQLCFHTVFSWPLGNLEKLSLLSTSTVVYVCLCWHIFCLSLCFSCVLVSNITVSSGSPDKGCASAAASCSPLCNPSQLLSQSLHMVDQFA